jgi:hypothetical protein
MAVFTLGKCKRRSKPVRFSMSPWESFFFAHHTQALTDKHGEIVPLRRLEGTEESA